MQINVVFVISTQASFRTSSDVWYFTSDTMPLSVKCLQAVRFIAISFSSGIWENLSITSSVISDRLMSRCFRDDNFFAILCHVEIPMPLQPEILKSTTLGNKSATFETNTSDTSLQAFKSKTVKCLQTFAHFSNQITFFPTSSCLHRLKSTRTRLGQYLFSISSKLSLTHLQPCRDNSLRFDPTCLQTWRIWAAVVICLNLRCWIQRLWRLSTNRWENLSRRVPRLTETFLHKMGSCEALDHWQQTRAAHFKSEAGRNLKIYDTISSGRAKIIMLLFSTAQFDALTGMTSKRILLS